MFESQEIIKLNSEETILNREHSLTLHYEKRGAASWYVSAGRPGYKNEAAELHNNEAITCQFGDLYEVRLLDANYNHANILLTKLSISQEAENIFNSSKIFNSSSANSSFSEQEKIALKVQMEQLQQRVEELIELTEIQQEYLNCSFKMLNDKLEKGSKEGWRQAAYGVVTSLACTFTPDVETAKSLFDVFGTYISSATNFMLIKG